MSYLMSESRVAVEVFGVEQCMVVNPTSETEGGDTVLNLATLKKAKIVFKVPDTDLGVMAVARALGFGMSAISSDDQDAERYGEFGITFRENGKPKFSEPVLMMSSETMAYREIAGGLRTYPDRTLVTYDDWDEETGCGDVWTLDAFRLHPGMADGWALVQSASSCATVKAEKRGGMWTVTLTMPILPNGRKTGYGYKACFDSAKVWYRDEKRKADARH